MKDDVYEELLKLKKEGESFSDVIRKLIKGKDFTLERYFGMLEDSEVVDEIEKYVKRF
ncbi:antitoxin [Archaeoglobales archaeon]|nr:MAG: antitoxin [Archaeoglobales archaeon]